ncbi:MAG: DJ-1/PfpI family protein [Anaerolineae bacterium]
MSTGHLLSREDIRILEDPGVVVTVASLTTDVLRGLAGNEVQPDALLGDAHGDDYDAVMFVGGMGYRVDDPEGWCIARQVVAEGKVVAALCSAQLTLARAGVVERKRVTAAKEPGVMEEASAIVTFAGVERDGSIITANSRVGPADSVRQAP